MKILHFFVSALAVLPLFACSGYDDSDLVKRIENLEEKVSVLQTQVNGINSDIAALRTTLDAVNSNDVVTNIRAIEENGVQGFEITYSSSGKVKIFLNSSSETPNMGVREVDGVLYWTWNGQPLLDNSGKMIPCSGTNGKDGSDGKDGITPKLEIQDGYWCVSYDNGANWTRLGKAQSGSGSSLFRSVEVVEGNLVIVLNDGTKLTIPVAKIEKVALFDEDNIVLSLGAISDTHIGNNYGSEAKLTSALTQLKNRAAEKDADGLDAVMVVGDLVNTAANSQISTFKSLYEGVFDPVKVPMIYTIGNHDMNPNYRWTASTVSQNAVFHSILGDSYFLADKDQTMRKNFECRHCVVGDYHILCITPNGTSPIVYDANVTSWLNKELKTITEENPDQYVIVLTHPMIYDTVYGSLLQDTYTTLGDYWSTKALSEILNGYPQAVTFGGHLHFPLNDPRSVWQGKFTAFGCASTSYMAIDNGGYENMASATVMNDAGEYSQGLLVQFDANGAMRVTRMDFYHNTVIGKVWDIAAPADDNSHLDTFNHTALKSANKAPVLSSLEIDGSTATFAAGSDDEFVHHYDFSLSKGGSVVVSKRILSDFYRCPQTSMMKDSYSVSLGTLSEGDYTAKLVAYDSWDAASEPLTVDFSVKSEEVDNLSDYLGTYSLNCKIFEDGKETIQNGTAEVTFSASGKAPNNVLISGLYQNAVLPARIARDSQSGKLRLGIWFDGTTGQKLNSAVTQSGKSYEYISFLPGLGTQFISGPYQFIPFPITSSENNVLWWGDFSDDGSTVSFNNGNKQTLVYNGTTYYIIAVSCVLSSTETLAESSFAPNWNMVYQANPGNDVAKGMTFTKK